jgi:hypothetical protein
MKMPLSFLFDEGPAPDGHVPCGQEGSEILFVNPVMSAGQPESFEPIALDPFQYRAFAYLAVSGYVLGR